MGVKLGRHFGPQQIVILISLSLFTGHIWWWVCRTSATVWGPSDIETISGFWTLESDLPVMHTHRDQATDACLFSTIPYLVLLGERPVLQNCYRHQGNNRYDTNHREDDGHRRVPGVLLFHVWERGCKDRQTGRRGEGVRRGVDVVDEDWRGGGGDRGRGVCVRQVLDPDVEWCHSMCVWERGCCGGCRMCLTVLFCNQGLQMEYLNSAAQLCWFWRWPEVISATARFERVFPSDNAKVFL